MLVCLGDDLGEPQRFLDRLPAGWALCAVAGATELGRATSGVFAVTERTGVVGEVAAGWGSARRVTVPLSEKSLS